VALAFAMLSLIVAGTVAAATYAFASWYLVGQRESASLTRAALDARATSAYLEAGATPSDALGQIPSVGTSQPMVRVDGTWYTTAVTVPPDALPASLLANAQPSGAQQRFSISDDPYFGVAIPVNDDMYVEIFPLRDLDRTLTWGGWILVLLTLAAAVLGGLIGEAAVGRVLDPVRRLSGGARRLAEGDLTTRMTVSGDPDLDPIAESFNEMAESVQARLAREVRFTANVSHELRSPVTSVLGMAELLEGNSGYFHPRDKAMMIALTQRVRRMSKTLVDLLEISRIGTDEDPQWETADVSALCGDVLTSRGLSRDLLSGDPVELRTDARRLDRIIGNLVDNAQNHGGGLTHIATIREAHGVTIVVDDSGPGIEPGMRERLFEPFARGDRPGVTDGAGLGLAIAREQAGALGGQILIDESPTGGARFTVRLPESPEMA
jgi:signal transduction histidine kinase